MPRLFAHVILNLCIMADEQMEVDSDPSNPETTESDGQNEASTVKSSVWKFFTKVTIGTKRKAECNVCSKKLAYCGGTTNLWDHLKLHPLQHQRVHKAESAPGSGQSSLDSMFKSKRCSESRSKEITEKLVSMIVLDIRPIRTVECKGLRALMSYLEPGYVMPSRKTIKTIIRHKHELGKKELAKILEGVASVSFSTDIWTSLATEAYISVSVHYVSTSWECVCFILETKAFPGSHTGETISEHLLETASAFGISEKVSAVVHDQAANMCRSLRILNDRVGWESLACNVHKLQLCLKAGLDLSAIDRLVKVVSKLVGHFKHSALATGELKVRQTQMNITEKKLIQSCETRWNSTLYMLDRVNEMRWPVSAVLSDDQVTKRSDRYLDLTNDQWLLSEELVKILVPFEVATTFLCAEEQPTISSTLPLVHSLVDGLKPKPADGPTIARFKETVANEMKRRWKLDSLDTTSCMVLSAVMDPRFRPIKFLSDDELEDVKVDLVRRIDSFPNASSQDGECVQLAKKKTAIDILFGEEPATGPLNPLDEVTMFLAEKPVSKKTSLLTWWKDNSSKYPRLALIARQFVGIPATSATSERTFSTAGMTASKLRSSLKPSNLDALVFLKKNMELLATTTR